MLEENAIRVVVSTDCVIFGYDGKMLNVMLIERDAAPYMGLWELPGGLLGEHESAEQEVHVNANAQVVTAVTAVMVAVTAVTAVTAVQ